MPLRHNGANASRRVCSLLVVRGRRGSALVRSGGSVSARGVMYVHSAPAALCPHVAWAVAGVVGVPVKLDSVAQPAAPGNHRAELNWQGRPGTAGEIASALNTWQRLRFEVTEEGSPGCDAVRYSYTPTLGMFTAITSAAGRSEERRVGKGGRAGGRRAA